jgi:hypothetical protein
MAQRHQRGWLKKEKRAQGCKYAKIVWSPVCIAEGDFCPLEFLMT